MDMNKIRPASDAAWYCRKDAEEERFYEIFFQLCRKYSVRWASATPKGRSDQFFFLAIIPGSK